jgi:hypothetical protein
MQNYRRGSILMGINDPRSEERTSITNTNNAKFAKDIVNATMYRNLKMIYPIKIRTQLPTKNMINFGNDTIKNNNLNILNFEKKNNIINIKNNYYQELNYLNNKCIEKNQSTYNLSKNGVKYLVIMACHCNTYYKLLVIKQNIKYLMNDSTDFLIVNSCNLSYNNELRDFCTTNSSITYMESENENTYDFGKWIFGLKAFSYSKYNFIVFTNDSFIIHAPIEHYFNLVYKNNVEFYGYNSSTQNRYHYQSYLFSIKVESIDKFINNFNIKRGSIRNQEDVIFNYELTMTDWFITKKCFLDIGVLSNNREKNIFFTNNALYSNLKKTNLLPFTKIKSIAPVVLNNSLNFINTYIHNGPYAIKYESDIIYKVDEPSKNSIIESIKTTLESVDEKTTEKAEELSQD